MRKLSQHPARNRSGRTSSLLLSGAAASRHISCSSSAANPHSNTESYHNTKHARRRGDAPTTPSKPAPGFIPRASALRWSARHTAAYPVDAACVRTTYRQRQTDGVGRVECAATWRRRAGLGKCGCGHGTVHTAMRFCSLCVFGHRACLPARWTGRHGGETVQLSASPPTSLLREATPTIPGDAIGFSLENGRSIAINR